MAAQTSDSILTTIKDDLGLTEDYTPFDSQIIGDINAAFFRLCTLGVGPSTPFAISSSEDTWSQFDGEPLKTLEEYIHLKVELVFDPPSSSAAMEAVNKRIDELEFLLNVYNDDGSGGD